jgi:hypothetical protein
MRRLFFFLLAACGGSINAKPDAAPEAGPDVVVVMPEAGPPEASTQDAPECALVDVYEDGDRDGFGVKKSRACPSTPGYAPIGGDCDDANADVHPGQTAFFTTARADGTFDYDCDAKETQHWPDLNAGFCLCTNGQCSGSPDGWDWDGNVPACGANGDWFSMDLNDDCNLITSPKTQACR